MSERDCIHGQLARSCGLCERDATIAALQAEVERYKGYQNIEAQHDETGRIWSGPRYKMPARYVEISNESGEPPSGERSARIDAPAIAASPELADKKALVLYFNNDEDRDYVIAACREAMPNAHTVETP